MGIRMGTCVGRLVRRCVFSYAPIGSLNVSPSPVALPPRAPANADGVSFAIPIDAAVDVMMQLKAHGRVIRPYVGIKMLQVQSWRGGMVLDSFRRGDSTHYVASRGCKCVVYEAVLQPRLDGGRVQPRCHCSRLQRALPPAPHPAIPAAH